MAARLANGITLPSREGKRECGTRNPEKTFDLVPVAWTVCG